MFLIVNAQATQNGSCMDKEKGRTRSDPHTPKY